MKREVERESKLPAFSIGVAELEVLWGRLLSLYDDPKNVFGSIDIKLPKEKLEFKSIDELKQYQGLKGKITTFSLWLSKDGKRISIRSASLFNRLPTVTASADTEAWCAGATETVYSFLQSYKVWYHWFLSAPIGWMLVVLINIPTIAIAIHPKGVSIDKFLVFGWVATVLALTFLYFYRGKLFPSVALIITEEEGFIRRHSAELGLIIAILSAIITIVGWFIGKSGA